MALEHVRAEIIACTFRENEGSEGGAVRIEGTREETVLEFRDCTFQRNEASAAGGALSAVLDPKTKEKVELTLRIEGGRFADNRAPRAGGLHLAAPAGENRRLGADLRGVEFEGNRATKADGGAVGAFGPVKIDAVGLRLRSNRAEKAGGAFRLEGATAVLDRCEIRANEAGAGGGIHWEGVEPSLGSETTVDGNRPDDVVGPKKEPEEEKPGEDGSAPGGGKEEGGDGGEESDPGGGDDPPEGD